MEVMFYSVFNKEKAIYPCVYLRRTDWSDTGFQTNFEMVYYSRPVHPIILGFVKIGVVGQHPSRTRLPDSFFELSSDFFSIGQSRDYYEGLYSLPAKIGRLILKAIRDVRTDPSRIADLKEEKVFQYSVARNLGALQLALKGAGKPSWISTHVKRDEKNNNPRRRGFTEDLKIEFTCGILGAAQPVSCDFTFSRSEDFPGRTNVLVGKNGVGKTQFLANFVGAVTGIERAGYISESRAELSQVFAVSYNVFDKFFMPDDVRVPAAKKKKKDYLINSARYEYIGIRESNAGQNSYRVLGSTSLSKKFTTAVQKVKEDGRFNDWMEAMAPILKEAGLERVVNDKSALAAHFRKLGAGHKVAISILTCLFSRMSERSLVVMDEPENHLHPSLLSSTIHALRRMLAITDSYAIISTHSPMVVQETPARCVRVLSNRDGLPKISSLGAESLGASIDSLVSNIFGIHTEMPDYRTVLKGLAKKGFTLQEVNEMLGKSLSSEAASYFASVGGAV